MTCAVSFTRYMLVSNLLLFALTFVPARLGVLPYSQHGDAESSGTTQAVVCTASIINGINIREYNLDKFRHNVY